MYKIYINGAPLLLMEDVSSVNNTDKDVLIFKYTGKSKTLFSFIDQLEKGGSIKKIILWHPNLEKLWGDFQTRFKVLEAAGGAVFNTKGELMLMYRRGSWDLPKGKIDEGETQEEAAVREVQEETGVQYIERGDLLTTTYHTYKDKKGKRILKPTYWYRMTTTDMDLTPQTEEDIEEVRWVAEYGAFIESGIEIYPNIVDVIEAL